MSHRPTREERIKLQEHDDGDPDDTVYRANGSAHSTVHYHDDKGCARLKKSTGDPDDMTRRAAKRRWLAPCSICTLGKHDV